jgi:hypothetical protein
MAMATTEKHYNGSLLQRCLSMHFIMVMFATKHPYDDHLILVIFATKHANGDHLISPYIGDICH